MGIPVLILGESGSGKSCSMRNFEPDEVGIFNVASKRLPFRAKLPTVNQANYSTIITGLKKGGRKTYVIDDSQYLLAFEMFNKVEEAGYKKFTDMALHFYNLIQYVIQNTSDDCIVYFLHHTETTAEGRTKAKTQGKMLDDKLTVEGLFSIVLGAKTDGTRYYFETANNGCNTVKSPLGMFGASEIDNDLKVVDTTIREYYELNGGTNND